jgi:hypothetical protein
MQWTVDGSIMLQFIYSAYWIARFLLTTFALHLQTDTASHVVTVISLGALNCCVLCTRARADTHTHTQTLFRTLDLAHFCPVLLCEHFMRFLSRVFHAQLSGTENKMTHRIGVNKIPHVHTRLRLYFGTNTYLFVMLLKLWGARSSVVVKALCYKPEGRGFDTRWGDFF